MKNIPEKMLFIVNFRMYKFWRGEKKDVNTANAALIMMIIEKELNQSVL